MRIISWLYLLTLLPLFSYADAGFNIGRPKAPCYAVFTGIDKLAEYEFIKTTDYEERRERSFDSSNQINNNDTLKIYYEEGRRHWQGPLKILVRNKATQQFVDSFVLNAEGYDLAINFTGVENNILKYTIDKTKAEYPYEIFPGDNVNNSSVAKRNKFILISLSAIGFLTLAFMFYKRRNAKTITAT